MSRQSGVTLLELILVIGLASVMTLLSFYEKQADLEQARARQVGGLLYQYNNAVRNALAQGLVTSTTLKVGTNWLKNSSCGGTQAVDSEFLPCDFPSATVSDPITFGRLDLTTSVIVSGTAPNAKYTATTLTSPFTLTNYLGIAKVRADLAGVASLSAAAALTSGFQSSAGGLTPYTATTDASYKSDALTAKITIIASNNANNDVWLRTDGGNKMHASLGFDSTNPIDRGIIGASYIENLAGQVLRVGSGSGLAAVTGSGVVIDSNTEILGDFRIRKALVVDSNASVNGNVNAAGSVTAAANVNAGGAVVAQIFYDANNTGYYVDPHATSNLNALYSNYIASNGRVRAAEFVEIGGVANVGWGCSPNGLVGRDPSGAVISCQNGIWSKGGDTYGVGTGFMTGIPGMYVNRITGGYSCPAGLVPNLIGGVQIGGCMPCLTYSCSPP